MKELALLGYPSLAADTIILLGDEGLVATVGDLVRQLNLALIRDRTCGEKCAELLFEVALNLIGMERKRSGFSEEETTEALDDIIQALKTWEEEGRREGVDAIRKVIGRTLLEMKMVLKGKSMVSRMAEEIESRLDNRDLARSFINSAKEQIQSNVYYRIVDKGLSKFGNDSATGLRWARHLGAVQVSSNPVIAARAFEEVPNLLRRFESLVANHPEWREDPVGYGDEIALFGTVVSLLPNVLDFRPIALASDFRDGMVSIQLNPLIARSVEESLADALKIYSILQEILVVYDSHLSPRRSSGGRPNVVFKVSTAEADAIGLTESLNKAGLGTNNTVTFTVSQELRMSIAAMKGLAAARKSGIPVTRIYITNMEGRLEDHLRESLGAELLRRSLSAHPENAGVKIETIAKKVGVEGVAREDGSLEGRLKLLCGKAHLKTLRDDWFVEALEGEVDASRLEQMEDDIRMAGILVTRKVFKLVFSPEVKSKWVSFVAEEFGVSRDKALDVVETVDLLPSSKRREEDTYLVLGSGRVTNLTNTEFPDHQLKVWSRSLESGFELADYEGSIALEPDPALLKRLLQIEDFRKAYSLTPALVEELRRIGIAVSKEDEEGDGLEPEQWSSFGPAEKTMKEFGNAYTAFRSKLVGTVGKKNLEDPKTVEVTGRSK